MVFGLGAISKVQDKGWCQWFHQGFTEKQRKLIGISYLDLLCREKNFKLHSKTIHGLKSLIISLSSFRFEDIRYLTKVPGLSRDNILVVDSEMAKLISTKDLHTVWTLNVSRVLR